MTVHPTKNRPSFEPPLIVESPLEWLPPTMDPQSCRFRLPVFQRNFHPAGS